MRHIISVLLQNEAGALTRVASLFSTRGFNIESLSVAPTEDPLFSRFLDAVLDQTLSIAVDGDKIAAIYSVRNPEKLRGLGRGVSSLPAGAEG